MLLIDRHSSQSWMIDSCLRRKDPDEHKTADRFSSSSRAFRDEGSILRVHYIPYLRYGC